MGRHGFFIDMKACVGCRTCQIACKDKHNFDVGILYRKVFTYETGEYPKPGYYHHSHSCYHCKIPKCVHSCPTGALYAHADGTILYNKRLCITCKYCIKACPYDAIQYIEGKGYVAKCDGCLDLRKNGKNPTCVDACMMRSLKWGDLAEIRRLYPDETLVADIAVLPDSSQTEPALLIRPREAAFDKNFRLQEI